MTRLSYILRVILVSHILKQKGPFNFLVIAWASRNFLIFLRVTAKGISCWNESSPMHLCFKIYQRSFLSCRHLLIDFWLNVSGLTESLFSAHKEDYPEHEQESLKQLYQAKVGTVLPPFLSRLEKYQILNLLQCCNMWFCLMYNLLYRWKSYALKAFQS